MQELKIQENVDITPYTNFQIGGPARYFMEITEEEQIPDAFQKIKELKLPYFILGGGSNVLFSSRGYDGCVIHMKIEKYENKANAFTVGAGHGLGLFINKAVRLGFGGIQGLVGIPGTLGGAVRGNAGAYGREISQFVSNVRFFDTEKMDFKEIDQHDCCFDYRGSVFSRNRNYIIASVQLLLIKEDVEQVKAEIEKVLAERKTKPHWKYPSAGSIFKNVALASVADQEKRERLLHDFLRDSGMCGQYVTDECSKVSSIPAGYLVESVDLKGKQVGAAQVSGDHGNVIINLGGAKADDVMILISYIKMRVRNEFGIQLKEEIVYVG